MDDTLRVDIAFARLELLELEVGRRTLTQCPGIENVAKAIAKAKYDADAAHAENFGGNPHG